jgi:hypothetical protein
MILKQHTQYGIVRNMTTKNLIQKALEQIIPSEIIRNWFLEEAIYHKDPLGYGVPLDNDGTVMKFTPMTDSNLGFIRHRLQGVEITVENGIEAIAYTQVSVEDLECITRLLYLRVIEETAPKAQNVDGVKQTSLWAVFEHPEQYVNWVMGWGEPTTELIQLFIHASQGLNICLAHNSYQIPMIPDDGFSLWVAVCTNAATPGFRVFFDFEDDSFFSFNDLTYEGNKPAFLASLLAQCDHEIITAETYGRLSALSGSSSKQTLGYRDRHEIVLLIQHRYIEEGLIGALRNLVFDPDHMFDYSAACVALQALHDNVRTWMNAHSKHANKERYLGQEEGIQEYLTTLFSGLDNEEHLINVAYCLAPLLAETINPALVSSKQLLEATPEETVNSIRKAKSVHSTVGRAVRYLLRVRPIS